MKNLYKLITYSWNLAKEMYSEPLNSPEAFGRIQDIANEGVNQLQIGSKDYMFVRSMMLAILDYMEAEWREQNGNNASNTESQP